MPRSPRRTLPPEHRSGQTPRPSAAAKRRRGRSAPVQVRPVRGAGLRQVRWYDHSTGAHAASIHGATSMPVEACPRYAAPPARPARARRSTEHADQLGPRSLVPHRGDRRLVLGSDHVQLGSHQGQHGAAQPLLAALPAGGSPPSPSPPGSLAGRRGWPGAGRWPAGSLHRWQRLLHGVRGIHGSRLPERPGQRTAASMATLSYGTRILGRWWRIGCMTTTSW
jgi:hypothetical protein